MRLLLLILIVFLFSFNAYSDEQDISVHVINTSNTEIELKIEIPHTWVLYSNDPGDLGEKLTISLLNTKNIEKYDVKWPKSHETTEDIGGVKFKYRYYDGSIVIPIEMKLYDHTKQVDAEIHMAYSICSSVCMKKTKVIAFKSDSSITPDTYIDYIYFMVIALIGGFILNFMPCVLPVLSLKLNSMVKANNIAKNSLYTVIGIIFAFNILILMTSALKMIGGNIGWGLQFQSSYYISFLIIVLILFAVSVYKDSINFLPSNIQTYLATYSSTKESVNSFATGIISTMLALPCTAPFLGSAVAFALSRGIFEIAIIFNSIALGFALPYAILYLSPGAIKLLPKPGPWIVKFKKILAALLGITAIWFLFILAEQVDVLYAVELLFTTLIVSYILFSKRIGRALRFYGLIALLAVVVLFSHNTYDHSKKNDDVYNELIFKITEAIEKNQVVLINITADWCLTCKYNEHMVIADSEVREFIKKEGITYINIDYTHNNEKILNFIKQHDRYGIPFTIIFSQKAKKGDVLPEVLVKSKLIERLQAAG